MLKDYSSCKMMIYNEQSKYRYLDIEVIKSEDTVLDTFVYRLILCRYRIRNCLRFRDTFTHL
jgi:hypothetical protein